MLWVLLMLVLACGLAIPSHGFYQITFCMVTSRRPGNASYLDQVVGTYRNHNVFNMDGVGLVILDTDGGTKGRAREGFAEGVRLLDRRLATCDTEDVEGLPSCQVSLWACRLIGLFF